MRALSLSLLSSAGRKCCRLGFSVREAAVGLPAGAPGTRHRPSALLPTTSAELTPVFYQWVSQSTSVPCVREDAGAHVPRDRPGRVGRVQTRHAGRGPPRPPTAVSLGVLPSPPFANTASPAQVVEIHVCGRGEAPTEQSGRWQEAGGRAGPAVPTRQNRD